MDVKGRPSSVLKKSGDVSKSPFIHFSEYASRAAGKDALGASIYNTDDRLLSLLLIFQFLGFSMKLFAGGASSQH